MPFSQARMMAVIVSVLTVSGHGADIPAPARPTRTQDRAAIERLHQLDIEATLSDKADRLAQLWDRDAVRLQQGSPAEVGKDTIYANDKRWEARQAGGHSLLYKPDVKDMQIAGDWAFEWGFFEAAYQEAAQAKPVTVHGKQLRVLKRQPDGSWKFARVMAVVDSREPPAEK